MSKDITPEVCLRLDNEAYDGVPIAKRVREYINYADCSIWADDDGWYVEQTRYDMPPMPRYAIEYLKKIIKDMYKLKYME